MVCPGEFFVLALKSCGPDQEHMNSPQDCQDFMKKIRVNRQLGHLIICLGLLTFFCHNRAPFARKSPFIRGLE